MKQAFLLMAAFALIACSDDSKTSSSGSSNSTTTSAAGGEGGGMGGPGGGAGGLPAGACTNGPDQTILMDPNSMVKQKVTQCGQQNYGEEPAQKDCIKQMTNLSDPCVVCFDDNVNCV